MFVSEVAQKTNSLVINIFSVVSMVSAPESAILIKWN